MKEFNKFYFESFEFDFASSKAKFYYSFDNEISFEEIIDFKSHLPLANNLNENVFKNFLFNLHIALWISYYKLFPTKNLILKSWFLDDEQKLFWQKFYKNWLWEFFIKNDIEPNSLINFENTFLWDIESFRDLQDYLYNDFVFPKQQKSLLMWWWWKDSIVSFSLLKEKKFDLFVFGKVDRIKQETSLIAKKEILLVKRELSKNLFKLNSEWYYNWHVPITWIIAFVSYVFAYLYWYSEIILSNEKSASEENTTRKGLKINHQYSKSFEFELDLKSYSEIYLTKKIKYFSLLRWMYEYKISEIFSKQKEFFRTFSSCNRNFKIVNSQLVWKNWCCECEKCAFVFLILSPFLSLEELVSIFWENLFEKESLLETFLELVWLSWDKPFECVWTYEECFLSAYKTINKYSGKKLPFILERINEKINGKINIFAMQDLEIKLLKVYDEDIIPSEFKAILK